MNENYYAPSGYTLREWETSGTTTYIGYSPVGATENENWIIKRIIDDGLNGSSRLGQGQWLDRQTISYR